MSNNNRRARYAAMRPDHLDAAAKIMDAYPQGIRAEDLAGLMGKSLVVAKDRLNGLREAGRAEWITVPGGRNYRVGRWALTKHRDAAIAAAERRAREIAQATRMNTRKRQRSYQERKRKAEEKAALKAFAEKPVQAVVPASRAPRRIPQGVPNCVWALGAMA